MRPIHPTFLLTLIIASFLTSHAFAVTVGQIDTFEDGTTQGWFAGGLGLGAVHPFPPANALGGPAGASDNFLLLTSLGGSGAGGRLNVLNTSQWTGNYFAAGVSSIAMDLRNFGETDLSLRLVFEDPTVGPPTNIAFSQTAIFLPAGGGWTHAVFPIGVSDLQAGLGNIDSAMMNATAIRLYHSPSANFPNPIFPITPVLALLGADNIQAGGRSVPDGGSTAILLLTSLLTAGFINRRASAAVA